MAIFSSLTGKLFPLYLMILLGFIASRYLNTQKETISRILLYIASPVIAFYGAWIVDLSPQLLMVPLLILCCASVISILFLKIGYRFWGDDPTKNILSLTSGMGNTGYFGLPLILMILGEKAMAYAIVANMGFLTFENTLGVFLASRGRNSVRASVVRFLKIPTMYTFSAGLLINMVGIKTHGSLLPGIEAFKGTYTLLGMMLIGMSLTTIRIKSIDKWFIGLTFFAKFLIWPLLIGIIIYIDQQFLHIYSPLIHNVLRLLSIVPLATNSVAWASELDVHPEKASVAVFLSTMFALLYIPLVTFFTITQ